MVDTGLRVKKRRLPTGETLSLGAVAGTCGLVVAAELIFAQNGSVALIIPWVTAVLGVVVAGIVGVPILRRLKAGQIIREDGPQNHHKKSGTPTMGGIFVVPVGVLLSLLWTHLDPQVVACCLLTLGFGLIGWFDDWQILRRRSSKGLSAPMKLWLQGGLAFLFCTWVAVAQDWTALSQVTLPLKASLSLGVLFFPLAIFVLLGSNNATNLTDGLDGLAGGTGAIALISMAVIVSPTHPQIALFCALMGGSFMGFLWHNRHPARVFMGDTGSLALGGALAAAAILSNTLWAYAIVGALFIWESISVILQVYYFKATRRATGEGRRLFRMAPFHHHLELSGWHETQIVRTFYAISFLLGLLALSLKAL
jgi:phospho-N-acetylmuramoyl-pentapeptide-transferase